MSTDAPQATPAELSYRGELQRKALHLLALVVPLGMFVLSKPVGLALLAPLTVLAVTGDVLRVRHAGFRAFIRHFFGFMMRPREWPPLGGRIELNGATWVLLSATLMLLVFPPSIAAPAFAMFMLADAAAALIGRRFGRWHWWGGSRRTVEGSLAFLVVGSGALIVFGITPWWLVAVVAGAATIAEAVPEPFNDNLRVPVVAGVIMAALQAYVLDLPVHLF